METDTSDLALAHRSALDFLYSISEHVAKGNTFDETLASAIEFAVWLVRCEECVAYVRDGEQLVPWVWKYSTDKSIEQSRISIRDGYATALAEHQQPVAVSQNASRAWHIKEFPTWSNDPGEGFVSVPLLARSRLQGAIHLKHRQPRRYSRSEFKLLSSIGRLLGADIRISQLERENSDLLLELETSKLVARSRGILQRSFGLTETEANHALEHQSRQKGRPMKEIAQAIILSDEVRRSSFAN